MSSLDDLKYELASAGYSAERIAAIEQDVITASLVLATNEERIAHDLLMVYRVYHAFGQAMTHIVTMAGESQTAIGLVSKGIMDIAAMPDMPPVPTKPTERMPYYQRNKQKWWK